MATTQGERDRREIAQKPRYSSPTGGKGGASPTGGTSPQEPPPKVKGNQEAKAKAKAKVAAVKAFKGLVGGVEDLIDSPIAL